MKKLTIQYAKEIAHVRGGKCLSIKYINNRENLKWQCNKNHIWSASLSNIKAGKWCPYCVGQIKHTLKDCHNLANARDGYFLSKKYINVKTKYLWKCNVGDHPAWKATYNSIQQGHWCPKCNAVNSAQRQKLSNGIEIARKIAQDNGGVCLSDNYVNGNSSLLWRCKNNHTWLNRLHNILAGQWCRQCLKLSMDDCHRYASFMGGKCLSKEYINIKTQMTWECENGHNWKTTFNIIKSGKWCPYCAAGKTQKNLTKIICNIYPNLTIKINYRKFDWLKNKNGNKLEIDIYIPQLKLAIEYDGEQHFKAIDFFGGVWALKKLKKRDQVKNLLIKKHIDDIEYFIRFDYTEKNKLNEQYVRQKLYKCGVPL